MEYKISYGIETYNIDVTDIVYEKCKNEDILFIPMTDVARANIFSDPLQNVLKFIFITHNDNTIKYKSNTAIVINLTEKKIYFGENLYSNLLTFPENVTKHISMPEQKLQYMHSKLKIKFGNFTEEFPEQIMAAKYLTGNEKVLEIGGNIGRNSLIIGYILREKNNEHNFVVLESDKNISLQLTHNRDLNGFNFNIENSALSKRKLIQSGWDTICSDILLPGYFSVNTITFSELNDKYNIEFDTLVLDCEGAFYFILLDMPEILNNINLIIMENDYHNISHKTYIDNILTSNEFFVDYSQHGGWGPCYKNFFEVWKKKLN